jgi:uncharacterized protein CbrC (UPF0167 family)
MAYLGDEDAAEGGAQYNFRCLHCGEHSAMWDMD